MLWFYIEIINKVTTRDPLKQGLKLMNMKIAAFDGDVLTTITAWNIIVFILIGISVMQLGILVICAVLCAFGVPNYVCKID